MNDDELAINGGPPVRSEPLPSRRLFDEEELRAVREVFEHAWAAGVDFSFHGEFERRFTEAFCLFQGGGYADGVSSGTAAVYLALAALGLPSGSEVIVPPVTDPGGVAPVVLLGLKPVVADSRPDGFNVGPEQFEAALTSHARAAIITHLGGIPVEIGPILEIARARDIAIVEDCSQAPGAVYKGKRVGNFGRVAAFSTMFSKTLSTGGCGGLVYTRDEDLYWRIRSLADRGKPFHEPDFDPKDPARFLFPALNFNLDELSSAIGLSTLAKLPQTMDRRCAIIRKINEGLRASKAVSPIPIPPDSVPSPFFHTVRVDPDRIVVSKEEFAEAVKAEGLWIVPRYRYVVSQWPWLRKYLEAETRTPNAARFRDASFNILLNENFTDMEVADVVSAILKVEAAYLRT